MEKKEINRNVRKAIAYTAVLCSIAIPSSITPAIAYDGALPVSINQIMMESGGNIKHDADMLRYKRNEKDIQEDYIQYNQNRNFEGNEGQVIKSYDYDENNNGYMQGQVEDIDSKGVFINSIEVAPSEVLSKE